ISKTHSLILRNHAPQTGLEAKFSMEFAMAAAVISRRASLAEYTDEFVRRPEVQELMRRVAIITNENYDPAQSGASVWDQVVSSVLEIAAWTSCAAASMLRSRVNWSVMLVLPRLDEEVIWSTPAIVENCFSSGVATADAMVSGLAPGRLAFTWIVGKSTFGRLLTGKSR